MAAEAKRSSMFSFFIAPLFGTVLLGMLWKRATGPAGFWGLTAGTFSAIGLWAWVKIDPTAIRYVALSPYAKDMAENMFRALWSGLICIAVTVIVSLLTEPKTENGTCRPGLRLHRNPVGRPSALWQRPIFWAGVILAVFRGFTNHLLVGNHYASTWHAFDLVFHRTSSAGLWNPDFRLRPLRVLQSAAVQPVKLPELHAAIWWGVLLHPDRRDLYHRNSDPGGE